MTETNIKESEARILMFLGNASAHLRYPSVIASKLRLDYCYTVRLLRGMQFNGWVNGSKYEQKTFYTLTRESPYMEAMGILS